MYAAHSGGRVCRQDISHSGRTAVPKSEAGRPHTLSRLLCIPPPSSTQGSSGEGPHEQSGHTVILECATSRGKDCRGTEGEQLPSSLIHKHSCPTRRRQEADDRKPLATVTLPYIKGLSEAVRQILVLLDIKVVFCLLSTLRKMLVHSKDPVQSDQRKGCSVQHTM